MEDFHYECILRGQHLPATVSTSDGTVSCYIAEGVSWSVLSLYIMLSSLSTCAGDKVSIFGRVCVTRADFD